MRAIAVVGVLLAAGIAHADLDLANKHKDADAKLAEEVSRTDAKCGTKLAATYDWASEKSAPGDPPARGAEECAAVVQGIRQICTDVEGGKDAVAKKVKAVTCKYNAKVSAKKSKGKGVATDLAGSPAVPHTWLEFTKSTLHVEYDWFSANTASETDAYLRKQL